jgi:hypothetical protein
MKFALCNMLLHEVYIYVSVLTHTVVQIVYGPCFFEHPPVLFAPACNFFPCILTQFLSHENQAAGLTPQAAAARRHQCLSTISHKLETMRNARALDMLYNLGIAVGCVLGGTAAAGMKALSPGLVVSPNAPKLHEAADVTMLYTVADPVGDKRRPFEGIPENAFLGPTCRQRACRTCGLLPGEMSVLFPFCSLCRDPAVGRFCSREPCFAAFWKGGHKRECTGRDKKKKGEGK